MAPDVAAVDAPQSSDVRVAAEHLEVGDLAVRALRTLAVAERVDDDLQRHEAPPLALEGLVDDAAARAAALGADLVLAQERLLHEGVLGHGPRVQRRLGRRLAVGVAVRVLEPGGALGLLLLERLEELRARAPLGDGGGHGRV